MSLAYGSSPLLTRDGLAMYFDAGNKKSYSGTGNIWYDLSDNKYNMTLNPRTAGFTFSSGTFNFPPGDGTNYAYGYSTIPTGGYSWTVNCLFRVVDTVGPEHHIFRTAGNFGCDVIDGKLRYYMTEYNVETALTAANTFLNNTWYFLTMVYDRISKTQKIYRNGEWLASNTHAVQYSIGNSITGWFQRSDGGDRGVSGDVIMASFHTRALQNVEIKQMFDVFRGRVSL